MAGLSRAVPLTDGLVTSRGHRSNLTHAPTTPVEKRLQPYNQQVWAGPRSLAATEGVDFLSIPQGT